MRLNIPIRIKYEEVKGKAKREDPISFKNGVINLDVLKLYYEFKRDNYLVRDSDSVLIVEPVFLADFNPFTAGTGVVYEMVRSLRTYRDTLSIRSVDDLEWVTMRSTTE